jgi:hypothetical protein
MLMVASKAGNSSASTRKAAECSRPDYLFHIEVAVLSRELELMADIRLI